eukprot:3654461-Ditylum_brightwellii.AAC.1
MLVQYSKCKRHKQAKKVAIEREEKSQQKLVKLNQKLSEINSRKTLSDDVKKFRADSLKAIAEANISLGQFKKLKPSIETYARPGMSLDS